MDRAAQGRSEGVRHHGDQHQRDDYLQRALIFFLLPYRGATLDWIHSFLRASFSHALMVGGM